MDKLEEIQRAKRQRYEPSVPLVKSRLHPTDNQQTNGVAGRPKSRGSILPLVLVCHDKLPYVGIYYFAGEAGVRSIIICIMDSIMSIRFSIIC
jgi:hypothetical protein